jgi:hypothetical protein
MNGRAQVMKNAIVVVSLVMATPLLGATRVAQLPIGHIPALVSSQAPAWELCENRALKVDLRITVNEGGLVTGVAVIRATTPCAGLLVGAAVEQWKFTSLDAPEGMQLSVSWIIRVRN